MSHFLIQDIFLNLESIKKNKHSHTVYKHFEKKEVLVLMSILSRLDEIDDKLWLQL